MPDTAPRRYVLLVPCLACNRERHWPACDLCSRIEDAEHRATGARSPQLEPAALDSGPASGKDARL